MDTSDSRTNETRTRLQPTSMGNTTMGWEMGLYRDKPEGVYREDRQLDVV